VTDDGKQIPLPLDAKFKVRKDIVDTPHPIAEKPVEVIPEPPKISKPVAPTPPFPSVGSNWAPKKPIEKIELSRAKVSTSANLQEDKPDPVKTDFKERLPNTPYVESRDNKTAHSQKEFSNKFDNRPVNQFKPFTQPKYKTSGKEEDYQEVEPPKVTEKKYSNEYKNYDNKGENKFKNHDRNKFDHQDKEEVAYTKKSFNEDRPHQVESHAQGRPVERGGYHKAPRANNYTEEYVEAKKPQEKRGSKGNNNYREGDKFKAQPYEKVFPPTAEYQPVQEPASKKPVGRQLDPTILQGSQSNQNRDKNKGKNFFSSNLFDMLPKHEDKE
jgi:hypothetical protein